MSTEVDNRIVAMTFDNKQFESGTATSINTLDRLKKSLNLEGASKGLEGISAAANKVSFDVMSGGIDAIKVKFTALQVVAITTLTNITNSVVNAGTNLAKALTIDPVMAGFNSYETKIGAIKTVMSGTGETLDQVTKSLNDLNSYSDRTVYSFQDMTENISKFTNAGLSSSQAATAIKGISNVAALAGANAGEASRAMYNFGQALSSGAVKLMDWKSIENANMATVGFKNQLLNAAVAAGTLKKGINGMYTTMKGDSISATKGFNESLEQQWMTTNVLNATLSDYASETTDIGKQANAAAADVNTFTQMLDTMKDSIKTGWTKSWEAIIGNKDQAKGTFTAINNAFSSIVGPSIAARNAMLTFWNQNGGRDAVIEALSNSFKALGQILGAIGQAFHDAIPPATYQEIVNFSKGIRDLTKGFLMNADTLSNLELTFEGFFSIIGVGIKAIVFVLNVVKTVIQALFPATEALSGGFLSITAAIGVFFGHINEGLSNSTFFKDTLKGIGDSVGFLRSMFMPAIDALITFIKTSTLMADITSKIIEIFNPLVEKIKQFIMTSTLIEDVVNGITSAFTPYIKALENFINTSTLVEDIITSITLAFTPYIKALENFINTSTLVEDIMDALKVTCLGVWTVLKDVVSKISNINFGGASISVGNFEGTLNGLSETGTKIKKSFSGVPGVITTIQTVLEKVGTAIKAVFGPSIEFLISKLKDINLSDIGAVLAGGGILMLAKTFKDAISSIDKVTKGFSSIIEGISGSLEAFQTKLKADALLRIAAAIGILALSIVALSLIPAEALYKALGALTVVFTELSIGIMILQKASIASPGLSGKLIALGIAITLIASAVKKLSEIDNAKLATGVQGMTAILTVLAIFVKVTSGVTVQNGIIGLIGIAVAVNILCSAVEKFGSMDPKVVESGIKGIVSTLLVLAVFIKTIGNPTGMIGVGLGIAGIAIAINLFAAAIGLFALIPFPVLAKGMGAIAVSLLIMAIAANAMTGTLSGSAAIMVMAIALNMLVPAIALLGLLPLSNIGIALLALAGVFGVIGVAGYLLAPVASTIMTLALAIGVIGAGIFLLGGGLVLFAAGLAALAAGGVAFVKAFIYVVTETLNLIPLVAQKLGEGLKALSNAIIDALPSTMNVIKALAEALIKTLDEVMLPFIDAVSKYLIAVLTKIGEYIQPLVDAGLKLVIGFVKGIIDNLPQIVDSAVKFMLAFLTAIESKIPDIIAKGIDITLQFIVGIISKLPEIVDAAFKMVIAFIDGLTSAIDNNHQAIVTSVGSLLKAIVDAVLDMIPMVVGVGVNIIKGLILGITSMGTALWDAMAGMVSGAVDGVKKLLGIKSPSRVFRDEVGVMIGKGMAEGIKDSTPEVVSAADKMAQGVVSAAKKWIDDRKYYNNLSLEEELYVWETIQAKYDTGNAARIESDREVYRIKNAMTATQKVIDDKAIADKEAADKAYTDKLIYNINKEKYYTKLSLAQELASWKTVQNQYKEGTDEQVNAEKEVYRVQKEINDKKKSLEDDYLAKVHDVNTKLTDGIKSINDAYDSALKSRTTSLYNSYGLFDAVTAQTPVVGTDLVQNLKDQVGAFEDWQSDINALSSKGVDSGLIKELTDMGPKSASQIKALNTLSAAGLTEYTTLWKVKYRDATSQATSELESMRISNIQQIQALNIETKAQLAVLANTWTTQMNTLLLGTNSDWPGIGMNMVKGITQGLYDQSKSLADAVTNVSMQALQAAKDALGIHSPSKEFANIGEYSGQGFVIGISSYADKAANAAANVGAIAINAMSNSIAGISDIIANGIDSNPTITPVLDLSNIQNGAKQLYGLMSGVTNSTMSGSVGLASNSANNLQTKQSKIDVSDNVKNTAVEKIATPISNIFNIQSTDPKGVADEVARIIQKQIERRESAWV